MASLQELRILTTRRSFLKVMATLAPGLAVGVGTPRTARAETRIRSWTMSGQRWEFPQKAIIPEFEAKVGKKITVDLVATPIAETPPKVAAAMLAGSSEYDLITLDYNQLGQLNPNLRPLTQYMEKDQAWTKSYLAAVPPNVHNLYVWKQTFYGIANDSNCQLGFYRKDVFDQLGLKPADTWDQVPTLAKALTRDTSQGKQYGFTSESRRGTYAFLTFACIYWSSGGELWDEAYKPTLSNDLAAQCLDLYKQCFAYAHPAAINAADDDNIQAVTSGAAVYSPVAWGNNAYTNPALSKFAKVTVARTVPKGIGPKGVPRPTMGGFGYVIPKASRHQDEAWEFIKYTAGETGMETWVKNTGQPARTDALKKWKDLHPYYVALADSLPTAHWQPTLPETFSIYEGVGSEIANALLGQKTSKAALADGEKTLTDILRKGGYLKG
jgi:multiple sugar transport system substrate-binding protein